MGKKWTNNLALKIASVAIAVCIWVIAVNTDDPITTKKFSGIQVQIQNEAYIEKNGQICLFDEGKNTTTVVITGRRKLLESITYADVVATADMRQAISLDTDPVMLPITVSCRGIESEQIKATPQNIAVRLEEKVTQDYLVNVNISEIKTGKGYEIGSAMANPEKIRITGPASLMKKIDKVVASLGVSGITEDITKNVELKIIDKNQEEFTDSEMRYLKYDVSQVAVSVNLWRVKPDVKIEASYVGMPADGYQVSELIMTPETVNITGDENALSEFEANGNIINIPAEYIDVTGQKNDFETKVDLSQLLTGNMRITSDMQATVLVEAKILPVGSKEYTLSTKDIHIKNIPKDMEAVFTMEKLVIRIKAVGDKPLEDLEPSDIKAEVNLKGMKEGSYDVRVNVDLPEGYEMVEVEKTGITLSKIAEASASD